MANETASALTGENVEQQNKVVGQDSTASSITGNTTVQNTTGTEQATTTQQAPQATPTDTTSSITQTQTPQEAVAPVAETTSALTSGVGGKTTGQDNQQTTSQTSALTVPTQKVVDVTATTNKYVDPELQAQMDKINEKQRAQFVERTVAQSQALTDTFSQKMAQEGYAGTGVKNSLLAMLTASNNATMTAGLQDLAELALQNEFNLSYEGYQNEQSLLEESRVENMAIFHDLAGNPQEQINFAKMMLELDPNNPFWGQFSDPEFVKNWSTWQQPQVIKRESEMTALSNSLIFDNWETINTDGGFNSMFDEWSNMRFENKEKLGYSSNSWYKNASLEDVNDALNRLGLNEVTDKNQISDFQQINEIYMMDQYKKAVKQQTVTKISENAQQVLSMMGDSLDASELDLLETYASTFVNALGDEVINVGGFTGTFDNLINSDSMSFLTSDWDGKPYDQTYNAETIMKLAEAGDITALRIQRLDELWKAYLKNLPNESTPITRDEFMNMPEIVNISDNINTDAILRSSDADKAIKSGLADGGFLNKTAIPNEWDSFPDSIKQGLVGDDASKLNAITSMNPAQLSKLNGTDVGKKLVSELVANGQIQSVIGSGGTWNMDNVLMVDENGKYFINPIIALPDGTLLYSDNVASLDKDGNGKHEFFSLDPNGNQEPYQIKIDSGLWAKMRNTVIDANKGNQTAIDSANEYLSNGGSITYSQPEQDNEWG